jgi:hypothetical protein
MLNGSTGILLKFVHSTGSAGAKQIGPARIKTEYLR